MTDQSLHVILSGIPPSYYEPLYEGADLTILDSYILHYEFVLQHRLTKQVFSELIRLVSANLHSSETPALSVHILQQFFVTFMNWPLYLTTIAVPVIGF